MKRSGALEKWIVETDEETFRNAGLADMADAGVAYLEKLFAELREVVSINDVALMDVVRPGSRVTFRQLFAGDEPAVAHVEKFEGRRRIEGGRIRLGPERHVRCRRPHRCDSAGGREARAVAASRTLASM